MYTETRNRLKYPTMISVSPIQASVGAEAVLHLMQQYNWTSISIIYDIGGVAGNNDLIAALKKQSQNQIPPVQFTLLPTGSAAPEDLLNIVRSVSRSKSYLKVTSFPIFSDFYSFSKLILQLFTFRCTRA
jgi:hypothetical protein